jgi:hypothetical protein
VYKIFIHKDALQDIQAASDWYNDRLQGLGSRFQKHVKKQINGLKKEPTAYGIRYADVR